MDLSKIEEICHAALKLPPQERGEFLDQYCGDNLELRREVESLLSFEEEAESFIESPPEDLAMDFFASRTEHNIIGKTLNNYRILSLLGVGGMGEVYLAEDIKLKRKIAIKLLPSKFAENTERKGRFVREARAVSALNHPNIITVYGIEESDKLDFIVTELIDGKTVRERLSEKPFDWREVVEIAVQIADALESAHKIGIIHRDIKPANIMIREDGYVKVLDFGLAKMLDQKRDSEIFKTKEQSQNERRVMGTMSYMSPEQALGETLDARTDIFSFGVILYEMISGIQPFKGTSDAAIYNSILNTDPPSLSEIKNDIPQALEQIISLAINKDREKRYASISDMRSDLHTLKQHLETNSLSASFNSYTFADKKDKKNQLKRLFASIATLLLIVIFGWFLYSKGIFTRQTIEVKNFSSRQLTSEIGEELYPSLSPDGKTFIFSSGNPGSRDIYFQRVDGAKIVNLTESQTSDDIQAVYSPNGEKIAFHSNRDSGDGLYVMGATGESIRRLSDLGFNPAWSPNGKEIVYSTLVFESPNAIGDAGDLRAVNIENGVERSIKTDGNALQPNWSPNGHRIAYWGNDNAGNRNISTVSAVGGDSVRVTDDSFIDWNPVWSPDGKYLYFLSDRSGSMNLWRVSIDEKMGRTLSKPEAITIPSNNIGFLRFSPDGKTFIYNQSTISTNIHKVNFDAGNETVGENPIQITKRSKNQSNPHVSDISQKIVFGSTGDNQEDIFIADLDGSNLRNLTNDANKDRAPRLSPDGKRVAFFTNSSDIFQGWIVNADGSNLRRITDKKVAEMPVWSPDGKRLLFNLSNGFPTIYDPDKDWSEQTPQELPHDSSSIKAFFASSWSSDGNKLAGFTFDEDKSDDFISIYDFTANKYEEFRLPGMLPVWLADNQRLIYSDGVRINLLDTKTRRIKEILSVAPDRLQSIWLTNDNRSIYYSLRKQESDIWIASFEE